MLSLKQWFYKRAQVPVLATLSCLASILAVYLSYFQFQSLRQQEENAKQIMQVASLAIVQHNRTLLESTLRLGLKTLKARQVLLCESALPILTFPSNETVCAKRPDSFGTRLISGAAVGMPQYHFYFYLPAFPDLSSLSLLLSVSLFFLVFGVVLLMAVYRRIKTDLLTPLIEGIARNEPVAIQELDELRRWSHDLMRTKKEEAVRAALVDHKEQVLHDVRSPLIALDAAIDMIREVRVSLPERPARILRDVSGRIHALVNELQVESTDGNPVADRMESELLPPLVDSLIAEKRLRYRSRPEIEICTPLTHPADATARVDRNEFDRILSNIVDNAVEAIDEKGNVWVTVTTDGEWVKIQVRDDGKGIPKAILPRLMNKGESFGKKGGKGLGLYFAKTTVASWGGEIQIDSSEGRGTTVDIRFPKSSPPTWMAGELVLGLGTHVVVVDDDPSIHELWKHRFSERDKSDDAFHYFARPAEVIDWASEGESHNVLYLVDLELGADEINGLDLIQRLGIRNRSILVTGRAHEAELQQVCMSMSMGVTILPKSLIPTILIRRIEATDRPDAVLIDDDLTIREMWADAAERAKKQLLCLSRPAEFFAVHKSMPRSTPLYIDSRLGGTVRGEDLAREVHGLGFTDISLTTAFPKDKFSSLAWMREIRGKEPPWC